VALVEAGVLVPLVALLKCSSTAESTAGANIVPDLHIDTTGDEAFLQNRTEVLSMVINVLANIVADGILDQNIINEESIAQLIALIEPNSPVN